MAEAAARSLAHISMAGLQVQSRIVARSVTESQLGGEAARTIFGIRSGMADLHATSAASRAFAGSLTPEALAGYRGGFGDQFAEADRARFYALGVRNQVVRRGAELPGMLSDADAARARAAKADREATAALAAASDASSAHSRWLAGEGGYLGANDTMQVTGKARRQRMIDTHISAQTAVGQATMLDADAERKSLAAEQALTVAREKRLELARAELQAEQSLLQIKQSILQGAQGRATRYGLGTASEAAEDANLLRIVRTQGIGALTPEQAQRAYGIPGAAPVLQDMVNKRGDALGAGVREELARMAPDRVRGDVAKPLADLQDEVRQRRAAAQQKFDEAAAQSDDELGGRLADAVQRRVERVVAAAIRNMEADRQRQLVEFKVRGAGQ
jgi:hypothetical protein